MCSLPINDAHENLDSSMKITQDEQNNAEPNLDCTPTVRKDSTFKECTSRSKEKTNDKFKGYTERHENVQPHNNERKRSSRSEVYVDKSNRYGRNEKVIENSKKRRYIKRKPTSDSKNYNRSKRHGNAVYSSNQTSKNRRDQVKNPSARNDCVLLSKDMADFCEKDINFIIRETDRGDLTSRKHKTRSKRADRSKHRGPFVSRFDQKYMAYRYRVKSTIPRNDDVDLADDHSDPLNSTIQDEQNNMQPGPSTVRNRNTVEQQTTDNKSDLVEDSVAELDSIDINNCGLNYELIRPRIMSTDPVSTRSRTLTDSSSTSSLRYHRSVRSRSSTSSGHRSYYSTSYSDKRSRSRRSSIDRRSFDSTYYASYSDRLSREKRSLRDLRSSSSSSSSILNALWRLQRRRSSPYRRYRREARDRRYHSNRRESRDRRYRSDSFDRDNRNDNCGIRYSSIGLMLMPYRPYIILPLSLEGSLIELSDY